MSYDVRPATHRQYAAPALQSVTIDILRQATQFPTSPKALFLINALIIQGYLKGDLQARALLKGLPVEAKGMVLKMISEAILIRNARSGSDIPPPEALHPVIARPFCPWAKQSEQIPAHRLPEGIRRQIEVLFKRTAEDDPYGKRSEYASVVLELADGTAIRPIGFEATSYKESHVAVREIIRNAEDAFYRAQERAKQKQEIRDRKVKVYIIHTHPQHKENLDAVNVHEDGRYFTHLSPGDCFAVDKYFDGIVDRLRKAGFTGPIDITISAIPVPLRPQQDLSERLYVATYTREIPGVKTASIAA